MQVTETIRKYVTEKIEKRGQKELNRLIDAVDNLRKEANKSAMRLAEFDRTDGPDDEENYTLTKTLQGLQKEIRKKYINEVKSRLAKIGWEIGPLGFEFLMFNDLINDYTPQNAYEDDELSRMPDRSEKTKAAFKKAREEDKRIHDRLRKAEVARTKYIDRIQKAVQEVLVLTELGADIDEFQKIIKSVKI